VVLLLRSKSEGEGWSNKVGNLMRSNVEEEGWSEKGGGVI